MEDKRKSTPVEVEGPKGPSDKGWYNWTIKMENGDVGFFGSKKSSQDYFVVDKECEYIVTPTDYGNRFSAVKKPYTGGKTFQKENPVMSLIGYAGSYSKDLVVASMAHSEKTASFKSTFDKVFETLYTKAAELKLIDS